MSKSFELNSHLFSVQRLLDNNAQSLESPGTSDITQQDLRQIVQALADALQILADDYDTRAS